MTHFLIYNTSCKPTSLKSIYYSFIQNGAMLMKNGEIHKDMNAEVQKEAANVESLKDK